jgi:tripartite-type tricarboxylate transporter receptor subunit TctC
MGRRGTAAVAAGAAAAVLARPAPAQRGGGEGVGGGAGFPNRPVTLIVQYPPGGSTDIAARLLEAGLEARLGQTVTVENRPGGSGNVGFEAVTQAPPDGHTLLVTNIGPVTVSPHTLSTLAIDPMAALVPVALINRTPLLAAVNREVPHGSLAEFAAWAKERRGGLTFATSGQGAIGHVAMTLVLQRLGVEMEHLPYRGTAPAIPDLVAGRLTAIMDSLVSTQGLIREGRAAGLFVTGARRAEVLPGVPTLAESGMPDLVFYGWNGVFAPAGTPPALLARLHAAVSAVLADPATAEPLRAMGSDPGQATQAEFAAMVQADHARWGEVVRRAGIRAD